MDLRSRVVTSSNVSEPENAPRLLPKTPTVPNIVGTRLPIHCGMMRANFPKFLTLVLAVGVLALTVLVSDQYLPGLPQQPERLPEAVVTMGDSTLSGEGADHYEAGTNGENGNWCHRSPAATVHQLQLPPTVTRINLACSGATADLVGSHPESDSAEGSQTRKLAELTKRFRITDIIVQVGANDDPGFSETVNRCVEAWASRKAGGCAAEMRSLWPDRVERMQPKVVTALRDIRTTMSRVGYTPSSYSLTLQSYASPVSPDLNPTLQDLSGCPFLASDLEWIHQTGVPQLSEGLREVSQQAGARFLDLSRAGFGHEACTGSVNAADGEWFTRLSVDWEALSDNQRARHAMQESFHANAAGHAQFSRCLGQFLASNAPMAMCLPDKMGNLQSVPGVATPDRASP